MSIHSPISTLPMAAIGRFMPMYLALDAQGTIRALGPSLRRVLGRPSPLGRNLFEVMEFRRPKGLSSMTALRKAAGQHLACRLKGQGDVQLRGLAMPVGDGAVVMNLSFGIGVVDAVARFGLTPAHFAVTDLTIELLYLVEAKAAVMAELNSLTTRLYGEKLRAEEQALSDALTGLRNRRGLDSLLQNLVGQETPFGLMHLDLDYFKAVNDTYGHAAGDFVLGEVAQILRRSTRAGDTIARVGGDEFVLVMPYITSPKQLRQIGARLIADLSKPMVFQGQECRISGSIGLVASPSYAQVDLERMAADADAALYAAKRAGRGRAMAASPALLKKACSAA
jgi:diguanylate cyclase (GGDEF)-like protein